LKEQKGRQDGPLAEKNDKAERAGRLGRKKPTRLSKQNPPAEF